MGREWAIPVLVIQAGISEEIAVIPQLGPSGGAAFPSASPHTTHPAAVIPLTELFFILTLTPGELKAKTAQRGKIKS